MWYPAFDYGASEKMLYRDFFSTMEMEDKLLNKDHESKFLLSEQFADYYGINETELIRINQLKTNSYSGSAFPDKIFPLVIYIPGANGFSFENHMLCESIAEQGNVVISFNSKGTEGRWMDIVNSDFENLIRDIQFILGESIKNPMIRTTDVTLIGYSVGGHINYLTKMRDNRIGGIVSLDGSIKHDFQRTKDFIFNDYRKINCPILSISNQDFEDARMYLDSMYNADRYYYKASGFEHKDYKSISYVLTSKYDTLKYNRHLLLNDLVVSFINMINKKDVYKSFEFLNTELIKSQFLTLNKVESIPDIDDFKVLIGEGNFTNSKLIYNNIIVKYPQFRISEKELVDWGNRLNYSGFFDQAIEIYKLIIDIYPNNQSVKNKLKRLLNY